MEFTWGEFKKRAAGFVSEEQFEAIAERFGVINDDDVVIIDDDSDEETRRFGAIIRHRDRFPPP